MEDVKIVKFSEMKVIDSDFEIELELSVTEDNGVFCKIKMVLSSVS